MKTSAQVTNCNMPRRNLRSYLYGVWTSLVASGHLPVINTNPSHQLKATRLRITGFLKHAGNKPTQLWVSQVQLSGEKIQLK